VKTIINFSKRTLRFKVLLAFVICPLFLILPSCQKDDPNQSSVPIMDGLSSSALSIKDKISYGKVKDVEGNVYKTVKIGKQWWMAENLKTTRYCNGDLIGTTNSALYDEIAPKYQWPAGGEESNVADYGRLYTWYTVTDDRKICPAGWRVPTDPEWTTLTTYLGGEFVAGGKLKEAGYAHWIFPGDGFPEATNETGFTALPGGNHYGDGTYDPIGRYGHWWSSTEDWPGSTEDWQWRAWGRYVSYNGPGVGRYNNSKSDGYAVRCIKN
jgi:uncharacterized protein (TIGR02145 family)